MVQIFLWNAVSTVQMDVTTKRAPATTVSRRCLWKRVPRPVARVWFLAVIDTLGTARVNQGMEESNVLVRVILIKCFI